MNKQERLQIIKTVDTAWTDHIWFAQWLVEETNPETIVDLGVDWGYSTYSFALPEKGTVYGVDSFEGDGHAGYKKTFDFVMNKVKELEFTNIAIIKTYFDELASKWEKPIDILHIDGFHTYDSVKNDYETWKTHVKDDGVILFHDTCVFDRGFGVYQLLSEIDLPKTNFRTSYGLGVVSKNQELIDKIKVTFSDTIDPEYA